MQQGGVPHELGAPAGLSPWWRHATILVLIVGFGVLIWLTARAYDLAPPIPETVRAPSGATLFTRDEILAGQEVFQRYGLMENGSIWGHGAYLGPDYAAEYLHTLTVDITEALAQMRYGRTSGSSPRRSGGRCSPRRKRCSRRTAMTRRRGPCA